MSEPLITLWEVADAIERLERGEKVDGLSGFWMGDFVTSALKAIKESGKNYDRQPDCGTVGCIGGTILALARERELTDLKLRCYAPIEDLAVSLIGLSYDQADRLFYGQGWLTWPNGQCPVRFGEITPQMAAAECRAWAEKLRHPKPQLAT